MNGISVGPVVFDSQRFAAVVAIIAFLLVIEINARWRRWRTGARIGDETGWGTLALLAWILGARVGFVLAHWSTYAAHPLDTLKLWQGGFAPLGGWVAGAAVLLVAILRRRKTVIGPLIAAAMVAYLAHQVISLPPRSVVATLPAMQLTSLDGKAVEVAGRGKPVVLNLWATWCPPCRREMPMMVDMAARLDDVDFIFANQGEPADRVQAFLTAEGLPSTGMAQDPEQKLMSRLLAVGLPSTLVFDAQGALVATQLGEVSRAALNQMIDKARVR